MRDFPGTRPLSCRDLLPNPLAAPSRAVSLLCRRRPDWRKRPPDLRAGTRFSPFCPAAFGQRDGVYQVHRLVGTEINHLETHSLQAGNHASCHVVQVAEIPLLPPVSADYHGAPLGDPLHHAEEHHVGASGRAVNREKPAGGDVGAVQVVVRVAEDLAGFLRRRVWREWPVGNGVFAIRRCASRTVDAGRRCLYKFGHVIRLASPQQVQRTADVAVDIRLRIFHRCSHPGPRRQVDHRVEAFRKETVDCSWVGDVHSAEAEPLPGIELGEPPLFKPDVVGVIPDCRRR